MQKTKIFNRFLSLALCVVFTLCAFLNIAETNVLAAENYASRSSATKVYEDGFDADSTEHFEFFGRENGAFESVAVTYGTATDNAVILDSNGATSTDDAYKSAVLVNADAKLNQYMRIDFTTDSMNTMGWVRANKEILNNEEYITGYFVNKADSSVGAFIIYKAEIVDGVYKITQLGRCGRIYLGDASNYRNTHVLSMEICAVGSNPTVLTVKTYKSTNTNGTIAYNQMDVQTITDNTASLQNEGTVAISTYEGTTAPNILKLVYHSDDEAANTYLKNISAKSGVLSGTVLTIKQNTEYECSFITNRKINDPQNDPVVIKYVSQTLTNGKSVLGDIKNFSFGRTQYKGYNKFSGTFSLNTTDYADLFTSNIYRFGASQTVPIVVGVQLNNTDNTDSRYMEIAVREVFTDEAGNKTYGPNLIVNGNFTLGAFNWSDELVIKPTLQANNTNHVLNGTSSMQMLDSGETRYRTPNGRLTAMIESNNFDYQYQFLYDHSNVIGGEGRPASRSSATKVYEDGFDADSTEHFEFFGRENGAFESVAVTYGTATDNAVILDSNGATSKDDAYKSAILVNADAKLNQYMRIDFTTDSMNTMGWVRANKEILNNEEYITGYFVNKADNKNGIFYIYKAEIVDGEYKITELGRCGRIYLGDPSSIRNTHVLSMEICAVGSNPTVLTVKTYKSTNTNGTIAYNQMDVQTITDNTASLQNEGTVAISTYEGTTAPNILKLVYHSDDEAANTYLKNISAKSGVLSGTVLTVKQNTEYECSVITNRKINDPQNDPVVIKYVSKTLTGGMSVLGDIKNIYFGRTQYNGYNKFSCTFSLNTTDYADLFSSDLYRFGKALTVPIVVGVQLNNTDKTDSRYMEIAVREVFTDEAGNKTYGPNLIVNGNFKLGAFNWSDEIVIKPTLQTSNNNHVLNGTSSMQILDSGEIRYRTPNGRLTANIETNNFDYNYQFLYDPENLLWGDANGDNKIDILDFIRLKKICVGISEYSVFGDLSSYDTILKNDEYEAGIVDGTIDAVDLTELRSILLGGSKKKQLVSIGNKYLSDTLEPKVLALKTSISETQTQISTEGKTVYYVSSSEGNDNNNGLSEKTPFKTIDKINSLGYKLNNSVICFKRGDSFRGNIMILRANVTYTAYGVGDKPVIMGSPENGADPSKWELVSGTSNIYRYTNPLKDVGAIIFNEGESFAVKLCPHIKNGEYTYGYEALENNQFISIVTDTSVTDITDYNSYKNLNVNTVYLRCDSGNPADIYNSIEFNTYGNVVDGTTRYNGSTYINQNITVDNLDIRYTGSHGIGFGSAKNLVVQNCEISWIGGAILSMSSATDVNGQTYYRAVRFGNGVEVNGYCEGYVVKNCYIHDIYDAGITHQNGESLYTTDREYKDVEYSGNLIENCCYSIEYYATPSTNNINTAIMKNIKISDNIMRNAGYGICEQRISNDSETVDGKSGFNLGAHINGWYSNENKAENFVIENNIFYRSIYNKNGRMKSGLLILSAEDMSYLPTLVGNTYIQHFDENFASYGTCDSELIWDAKFDFKAEEFARTVLGDTDCSVYFVN